MTVLESLPIMLFVMLTVFAVLAVLFLIIKIFAFVFEKVATGRRKSEVSKYQPQVILPTPEALQEPESDEPKTYGGELVLKNIDEPTAALIMAIVSDESGIPLSELCFKSIKRKA
jgi:hypothetical protein